MSGDIYRAILRRRAFLIGQQGNASVRQAIQLDVSLFFPIILGQLAQFAMSYYEAWAPCGRNGF